MNTEPHPVPPQDHQDRRHWMSVLAKADPERLKALWSAETGQPPYQFVRKPETGLVMLRGRMGGSGAPFNLGEATVTRCAVRTDDGLFGQSYVMGRDAAHAEIAAVYDALLQDADRRDAIMSAVIAPLEETHAGLARERAAKAAATRVDFFTMVRGED